MTPASVHTVDSVLGTLLSRARSSPTSVAGQVLEHRAEVVVGRRQRADRHVAREHRRRDLVVAAVGIAGLEDHAAALEARAARRGPCRRERRGDRARLDRTRRGSGAGGDRSACGSRRRCPRRAPGRGRSRRSPRSAPRSRRARGSTRRSSCRPRRAARIRSTMSTRAIGSTPVSGSSSSRKSGSWAIAVASLVRCRMPLEKPAHPAVHRRRSCPSARARPRRRRRALAARHAGEPGHRGRPARAPSARPTSSRARARSRSAAAPRRRRTGSRRTRVSAPRDGRSRPAIILISVDLPAPLGPSSPTMPPRERPAHVGDAEHVAVPLAAVVGDDDAHDAPPTPLRGARAAPGTPTIAIAAAAWTSSDVTPRHASTRFARPVVRLAGRTGRTRPRRARSRGRARRAGVVEHAPQHDQRSRRRSGSTPPTARARSARLRISAENASGTAAYASVPSTPIASAFGHDRQQRRSAGRSSPTAPSRSDREQQRPGEHDRRHQRRPGRRACRARSRAAAPSARSRT